MKEYQPPQSIEMLNEAFMEDWQCKKKIRKRRYFKRLLVFGEMILAVGFIIWRWQQESPKASVSSSVEARVYDSVLTEKELERWEQADVDETIIPIQLNQEIKVQGGRAFPRIVNPVYSAYAVSIKMISDGDITLYQSEKLLPGTILEAVVLTRKPETEAMDAVIEYTIYDQMGDTMGTYPIKVKLLQK